MHHIDSSFVILNQNYIRCLFRTQKSYGVRRIKNIPPVLLYYRRSGLKYFWIVALLYTWPRILLCVPIIVIFSRSPISIRGEMMTGAIAWKQPVYACSNLCNSFDSFNTRVSVYLYFRDVVRRQILYTYIYIHTREIHTWSNVAVSMGEYSRSTYLCTRSWRLTHTHVIIIIIKLLFPKTVRICNERVISV